MARTMCDEKERNGTWWKVLVGVAMTLILAALALACTWGSTTATVEQQGVRIATVEIKVGDLQNRTTKVDTNQQMVMRKLDSQDLKLDMILKEMRRP